MTDARALPHDIDAEKSALGAALISPNAANAVFTHLSADHFYRSQHKLIFRAIVDLYRRSEPVEVLSVRAELTKVKKLAEAGGDIYLNDLSAYVATAANIGYYVGRVRELGTKAIAIEELTRIASQGYHEDITSDDLLVATGDALGRFRLLTTSDEATIEGFSTMGSFVDETDEEHDWLVPGVLERMDRVIVVASEGAGKTTLARQMAVMLAAGIHPFEWRTRIPPVRTLYIDLENPPPLVRRKARHLTNQGRKTEGWEEDRCWRWTRPGGIDLRKPHDQHLVERVIVESRCEALFLGPLYKAFTEGGGEKAEQVNGQVARILDTFRARYGIALWLETHAPMEQNGQRSLRPMGSGVWLRWPEFGIALRRKQGMPNTVTVERFRGDRDERSWPHRLMYGTQWPWQAIYDNGIPVEEARH